MTKKRLNICLITSDRVFELAYGGEGRFTISFGYWLTGQNHDVTVIGSRFATVQARRLSRLASEGEEHQKRANQKKIKALYPPYPIFFLSRWVMLLLWVLKILSINMKSQITIIHAQDTGYSGLAAVLSGKILRIPVVITSHGLRHKTLELTIHGKFKKGLLSIEKNIDSFTVKNADRLIALNHSIKDYFEKLASKKIDVIPVPIKLKNFQFSSEKRNLIRSELKLDSRTKVIGFVGRLVAEKNLLTLLRSFADAAQEDSLKLVIVGTGPLESELKEYASKRKVQDKVIFCGVRYDIDKILSSFDIFVLPSFTEGLSNALLEAMTSGRAIICSDISANRELLVHSQEALLVNPYDPEELKQAIQLLSKDDSLRSKLGCNAKIRANQYDEDMIFPKILQCYETLLKNVNEE